MRSSASDITGRSPTTAGSRRITRSPAVVLLAAPGAFLPATIRSALRASPLPAGTASVAAPLPALLATRLPAAGSDGLRIVGGVRRARDRRAGVLLPASERAGERLGAGGLPCRDVALLARIGLEVVELPLAAPQRRRELRRAPVVAREDQERVVGEPPLPSAATIRPTFASTASIVAA